MRIDADEIKANADIVKVIGTYVTLHKDGRHWVGLCPFHEEGSPSFTVTPGKNKYKCFAGGCGETGDVIDFLVKHKGITFRQACEEINGGPIVDYTEPAKKKAPVKLRPLEAQWEHIHPAPSLPATMAYPGMGDPAMIFPFRRDADYLYGFTCRFNLDKGKKVVMPYVYAKCIAEGWDKISADGSGKAPYHKVGEECWRFTGFQVPRPLMGLDLLLENPDATVLLVEGEKVVQALQPRLNPEVTVVMTWIGGADGIRHVDWDPISGRNVMFWPDHDIMQRYGSNLADKALAGQIKPWFEQAGNKAMLDINDLIAADCPERKWIDVPVDFPDKWDGADREWTADELREFVLSRLVDVPERGDNPPAEASIVLPVEILVPKVSLPPPPPRRLLSSHMEEGLFRCLGYDKNANQQLVYYFFSYSAKTVIRHVPTALNKTNLLTLADINWWESAFPGGKNQNVNMDRAQQYLIKRCHDEGVFKDDRRRGRGAWMDNGKIVIHTGEQLIIDGTFVPLSSIYSKYVYEIGAPMDFRITESLNSKRASALLEKAKWFLWDRPVNAYLAAGWAVIAPFGGVLDWRPHLWITGPSYSGKSFIMDFIKRMVGEAGVAFEGKTTESGVRGVLGNDSRAAIFDEVDPDGPRDLRERLQPVITYARSGSSMSSGKISKGTADGGFKSYQSRSCFCFLGIGIYLDKQADISRFSVLGVRAHNGLSTMEQKLAFQKECDMIFTKEYIHALQSRTMSLLPLIMKNAVVYAAAVNSVIGNSRVGGQLGILLSSARSLVSDKEVSYDEALKFVSAQDWTDERGMEQTRDEIRLFNRIVTHMVRVEGVSFTVERNIGELILVAASASSDQGLDPHDVGLRLRRMGFIVTKTRIYIANNCNEISKILSDTEWSTNYNKILERLPGAEKLTQRVYTPGLDQRGVSLPLEMVSKGAETIPGANAGVPESELPM